MRGAQDLIRRTWSPDAGPQDHAIGRSRAGSVPGSTRLETLGPLSGQAQEVTSVDLLMDGIGIDALLADHACDTDQLHTQSDTRGGT